MRKFIPSLFYQIKFENSKLHFVNMSKGVYTRLEKLV